MFWLTWQLLGVLLVLLVFLAVIASLAGLAVVAQKFEEWAKRHESVIYRTIALFVTFAFIATLISLLWGRF